MLTKPNSKSHHHRGIWIPAGTESESWEPQSTSLILIPHGTLHFCGLWKGSPRTFSVEGLPGRQLCSPLYHQRHTPGRPPARRPERPTPGSAAALPDAWRSRTGAPSRRPSCPGPRRPTRRPPARILVWAAAVLRSLSSVGALPALPGPARAHRRPCSLALQAAGRQAAEAGERAGGSGVAGRQVEGALGPGAALGDRCALGCFQVRRGAGGQKVERPPRRGIEPRSPA